MKKLYEESSVQAIADAIRAKAGTVDTYKIAEMPDAISNLPSGGGATEPYIEETYDSAGNLIEAKMHGYTKIRDCAFYNCNKLSTVNLHSGITSIGANAFYRCSKLVITTLPDGLTSIEDGTFYGCLNLAATSLPPKITRIGSSALGYCEKLSLTSLPSEIISIGFYAFNSCRGLTSITFEGTPETISDAAFINNPQLTTINVPWAEGAVANAPWGATNATINYNYTEG